MLSHLRSTRLLLVVLVSATALFAMPSLASAASPDHVSTSLEGCRPASTFTGPPFICPDGDYTSGNLGKFWNELDLVPHRLTLATGTDNTSGYTVTVAADYADGNCGFLAPGDYALSAAQITQANIAAGCMPGYDFISAPTLNPASTGTCTISSGLPRVVSPGTGGTDATIYRKLTITQTAGSKCIFDYYERLAVGSHLFSGSSLHSNLLNENLGVQGIGASDVSIPVKEIQPQAISKTMTATQGQSNVWSVNKSATAANLDYPNVCDASAAAHNQTVSITVTWTKTTNASGDIHVATTVRATNPAHRAVIIHVTDKIYKGTTPTGTFDSISTAPAGITLPANANNSVVLTHSQDYPAGTDTHFNDVATATYEDPVTQMPIPGTTTASAVATVVAGGGAADSSALIHDSESMTGAGLSFSVDSRTPALFGSFTNYTEGTLTTGPVVWDSGSQSTSGSVTFNKTVNVSGSGSTSGTLSDDATVYASDGVTVLASDSLSVPITATGCSSISGSKFEDLNANGNDDNGTDPGLAGWTFYVDYNDNGTLDAGEPSGTSVAGGAFTIDGVFPGTFKVREVGQAGWTCSQSTSSDQFGCFDGPYTFSGGASASSAVFGNYQDATVEITKVNQGGPAADQFSFGASQALEGNSTTVPALGAGGTFSLKGGDTRDFTAVKPDIGSAYSVGEAVPTGYRLTSIDCVDSKGNDSTDASSATGLKGAAATAAINVQSGEDVHCTFTNKSIKSSTIVVKVGDDHVYHGDTMHFSFTVTNTGDGPLSNVTLSDDKCPNVQGPSKQEGPNDSGAAFLDPGDVWTYTCQKPVPDHSAGEENPVVNTATVNATDEFGRPVSDTDSHSTRILHPAIAIDKVGPAQATQGDLVPYTLSVTNPGDESLAASTVAVADLQCASPPVFQAKNTGQAPDATPDSLDPGDTWVYVCGVQTVKGPSFIDNVASVHAADQYGHPVDASDTAHTVLGEQIVAGVQANPGSARLAGASGCVAKKFTASVRGKQIQKVVFSVDGKKRASVSKPDAKGRYKLVVDPRKYRPGSHLLAAKTTFVPDSGTPAKTMKLRFSRCVRKAAPAFTG